MTIYYTNVLLNESNTGLKGTKINFYVCIIIFQMLFPRYMYMYINVTRMETTKCRQVSVARYKRHAYKEYFKR